MSTTLNTRKATTADIPFLARIEYEASLPPLNHCFWEDLLDGTGTTALQFIEAELRTDVSNWGNVADFLILEAQDKPVAAAAGYVPGTEDYCPLRLSRLEAIAHELKWSRENLTAFHDRYMAFWGGDLRPVFLTPQQPGLLKMLPCCQRHGGEALAKCYSEPCWRRGDRSSTTLRELWCSMAMT